MKIAVARAEYVGDIMLNDIKEKVYKRDIFKKINDNRQRYGIKTKKKIR